MLVSDTADHITHASIGAKQSRKMGMSSSAEFFHVLSASLYSDQRKAPVREIICNADDIHKLTGIDKPVEITLQDGTFTVRDFGPGIPDDLIVPIYGVYGESTKKKSTKETGGFGLGSKSPFAYVDSFEVISCHKGVKTIYRLNKSDSEQNGEPSVVTVLSIPTTETGITVSMKVMPIDTSYFDQCIEEVVREGSINATLNGATLPKWEVPADMEWAVVDSSAVTRKDRTPVMVRYGAVLYPLQSKDEYTEEFQSAKSALNYIQGGGYDNRCILVIFAPPDSITMAPSREQLTYTTKTIETVKRILPMPSDMIQSKVRQLVEESQHSKIVELVSSGKHVLTARTKRLPISFAAADYHKGTLINQEKQLLSAAIHYKPERIDSYRIPERVLNEMRKQRVGAKTFVGALASATSSKPYDIFSSVIRKMTSMGRYGMELNNLFIVEPDNWVENWEKYRYPARNHGVYFERSNQFTMLEPNTEDIVELLQGYLVLTHRKESLDFVVNKYAKLAGIDHGIKFSFGYKVGRKPEEIAAVKKFANDLGLKIIDITPSQALSPVKVKAKPKDERVKYKVIDGVKHYVALVNCYRPSIDTVDLEKVYDHQDPLLLTKPSAVILRGTSKKELQTWNRYLIQNESVLHHAVADHVTRTWGHMIAVVPTQAMYDQLIAEGCLDVKTFVLNQVQKEIKESKTFYADGMYQEKRIQALPQFIKKPLRKIYGAALTIHGSAVLQSTVRDDWLYSIANHLAEKSLLPAEVFAKFKEIPLDKSFVKLCHKLATSSVIQFIDLRELVEEAENGKLSDSAEATLKFIFKHSEKFQ